MRWSCPFSPPHFRPPLPPPFVQNQVAVDLSDTAQPLLLLEWSFRHVVLGVLGFFFVPLFGLKHHGDLFAVLP